MRPDPGAKVASESDVWWNAITKVKKIKQYVYAITLQLLAPVPPTDDVTGVDGRHICSGQAIGHIHQPVREEFFFGVWDNILEKIYMDSDRTRMFGLNQVFIRSTSGVGRAGTDGRDQIKIYKKNELAPIV